jgi:Zn-dependent M16 (insulinase) family peptidase
MVFRLKSLEEGAKSALDLAISIFMQANLSDKARLREVLLEMRNDFASGVISSGNSVAALRASSVLSPTMANDELWRGASQLLFLDDLVKRGDAGLSEAAGALEHLREKLFSRKRLMCNITADFDFIPEAGSMINSFLERIPLGKPEIDRALQESPPEYRGREEALIVPSSVNFVAAVLPGARIDSPEHPLQLLLSQILKTTFLWERIRMRGGAYGAGAFTNGLEAMFGFSSYRDPNILSTVKAFREGLELVAKTPPPQEEIEKAIISIVGKETRPQSPGEKSMIGFRRLLFGISDEMRQKKRDILLNSGSSQVAEAARKLLESFEERSLVVVAGKAAADKAGGELPGLVSRRIQLPV